MITKLSYLMVSLGLTACFEAANLTTTNMSSPRDGGAALTTATTTSGSNGSKATARIDASSNSSLQVAAPLDGSLAGTSISIAPGTFQISTSLVLEAGVSLSDTSLVGDLDLASDIQIQGAGAGVVIRPSEPAVLNGPLAISLPLPGAQSLSLAGASSYAVYFKYQEPTTGRLLTGIMPIDDKTTFLRYDEASSRDVIQFNGYFGSYWPVMVSRAIAPGEVPPVKETSEPIVNKNLTSVITSTGIVSESSIVKTQEIATVSLGTPEMYYDDGKRSLTLSIAEVGRVSSCRVDFAENSVSLSSKSFDAGRDFIYTHAVSNPAAHSVIGRFRCSDDNGRIAISPWSSVIAIPGVKAAPTPAAAVPPVVSVKRMSSSNANPPLYGTVSTPTATVSVTVNSISYPAVNHGDGTWSLAAGIINDLSPAIYDVSAVATGTDGQSASTVLANALTVTNSVFVSTWDTSLIGESGVNKVKLPLLASGTYDFFVDWGDGKVDHITSAAQAAATHSFMSGSTRTVKITGQIEGWAFNSTGDSTKFRTIAQWGPLRLGNSGYYFAGCDNLLITAADVPDFTGTTDMTGAFMNATNLSIVNISDWVMNDVTKMDMMFKNSTSFNGDIGTWMPTAVVSLNRMLEGASSFNQNFSGWNFTAVTTMANMLDNSGLDSTNYGLLLNAWANGGAVQSGVQLGALNLTTSLSGAAVSWTYLTNTKGWTIIE